MSSAISLEAEPIKPKSFFLHLSRTKIIDSKKNISSLNQMCVCVGFPCFDKD